MPAYLVNFYIKDVTYPVQVRVDVAKDDDDALEIAKANIKDTSATWLSTEVVD